MSNSANHYDVVLVGAGIMSATLGTILAELEPDWRIGIFERLDGVALESSDAWNNAGTGHAAWCELNYTSELLDGTVEVSKAVAINRQFSMSQRFWSALARAGALPAVDTFMREVPHLTLVTGEQNVEFLRRRFSALSQTPEFAVMEFSQDPETIAQWTPLVMAGRNPDQPVAATRVAAGTDVDFGALTRNLVHHLERHGADVQLAHEVRGLKRNGQGWKVRVADLRHGSVTREVTANFVFVGAGGWALPLLQRSGIKEIRGYGGFPISGQFLRTTAPHLVSQHQAKVYGKADVGSPPMSVPHLDTRVVGEQRAIMFGPYAGFTPKFLKTGSVLDLFRSIRPRNLVPMIQVALRSFGLVTYLVKELAATPTKRFAALQKFFPEAKPADWEQITAGQRVQVIRPGGVLQFGTEVVAAADGSIAGLLGASPGASTAPHAMLDVIKRCFPQRWEQWQNRLDWVVEPETSPKSDERGES